MDKPWFSWQPPPAQSHCPASAVWSPASWCGTGASQWTSSAPRSGPASALDEISGFKMWFPYLNRYSIKCVCCNQLYDRWNITLATGWSVWILSMLIIESLSNLKILKKKQAQAGCISDCAVFHYHSPPGFPSKLQWAALPNLDTSYTLFAAFFAGCELSPWLQNVLSGRLERSHSDSLDIQRLQDGS